MLDILRRNAKSVLTYVLFGIIIVVFVVSFGPGSRGCSDVRVTQSSWAARVNGEPLSGADFEQAYASLFRSWQARAGQGFTRELAEQMGLRRVAMDQLIEREMLVQEGEKLGIAVTDEELEKAIWQSPGFHVDGRFNKELYQRAVSAAYGTPARFEARMRRDLLAQKVLALLRGTAQVSEEEVRQAFESESDRVSLEFVRFPLSALKGEVRAAPEQVKAFQAREAARIATFYKDNPDRFDRKKRVRARHLLVRVDENAPAEKDAAGRKKVEEALERARKGEDFARIAEQLSEDPSSQKKGGDLGWFGPGVMAKPFEEAAFSTPRGGLAGPIRTRFGWHAIQVTDVQEPEVVPLDKAAPEIARELLEGDLAQAAARKRASEALALARKGKALGELFPAEPDAKAPGKGPPPVKLGAVVLRPDETGSFGAGSRPNVPRLGPQAEVFADAFAAKGPGLLPRVYDTTAGPVIARVKERTLADPTNYAGRRAEIEDRLRSRREAQIEASWARALREKAAVQVNQAYLAGPVDLPPVQLDE
jgi:peptidyl-prolyl cis-trans isomerase D